MSMSTPPIQDRHSPSETHLIMAVRDALRAYVPVRVWGKSVDIDAVDGNVILSGVVRSRSAKERANQIAAKVSGVRHLENQLIVDDETELAVAQALATDPRTQTAFPSILVGVVFGVAYLKGAVDSLAVKTAAGEIALKVPGVRAVGNELQAPAAAPAPAAKATAPKAATTVTAA